MRVVHVTWKRGLGNREEKKKMGVSMEKTQKKNKKKKHEGP